MKNKIIRKAILIGAPGGIESQYLAGVQKDLRNIERFLLSARGGAWMKNEIIVLPEATLGEVASTIHSVSADYSFIYFSGHGFTDINNLERVLCLQDWNVSEGFIYTDSLRELIIIDACRTFVSSAIGAIQEREEEHFNFTGDIPNFEVRQLFDRYILSSPHGRIVVHATQPGEISLENKEGGYFTQALLHVSTRIAAESDYTCASIIDISDYIPSVLRKVGSVQAPEILAEGDLRVPFAIGIPVSNRDLVAANVVIEKKEPEVSWGGIAAGALILLAIVASTAK